MKNSLRLVRPEEDVEALRWRAVECRDASTNGDFWPCVKTTGVYCLPSCAGRPLRRNVEFAETRLQAEAAGYRPCKRCRPDRFILGPLSIRIESIDWQRVQQSLNADGWASLGRILTDDECQRLINDYENDAVYRSRVIMRRHGFGEGEYSYYNENPPTLVKSLRQGLYEPIAPIANQWMAEFGREKQFPESHDDYRKHCADMGQSRPTPLILKYGPGDHNRLHQDLYGEEIFPIQIAILLSEPKRDFEGGAFIMTEQTPRRQSRVVAPKLEKGDAIAFAVNERPVKGVRGIYRVKMRHGVADITDGQRFCLGIIFHDAA